MTAAVITAGLVLAVGGAQAVSLDAGGLWIVARTTGAAAPVITAQLAVAIRLAGLKARAVMAPGDRVWAGATGGATAIIATDLPDATTGRALALEAIGVSTTHTAGAAAAIRATGLAVTVGLTQTLPVEADVLGVGALTADPATPIITAELALAVGSTHIGALVLVAVGLLRVLADATQDATAVVSTLLGRARARLAATVDTDLTITAQATVTAAAVRPTFLSITAGLTDAQAVLAGVVDPAT